MSSVLAYGANRQRIKLGDAGVVKFAGAREQARNILAERQLGIRQASGTVPLQRAAKQSRRGEQGLPGHPAPPEPASQEAIAQTSSSARLASVSLSRISRNCRRHSSANPGRRVSGTQIWTARSPAACNLARRRSTRSTRDIGFAIFTSRRYLQRPMAGIAAGIRTVAWPH
jgi:hypothetical protein